MWNWLAGLRGLGRKEIDGGDGGTYKSCVLEDLDYFGGESWRDGEVVVGRGGCHSCCGGMVGICVDLNWCHCEED